MSGKIENEKTNNFISDLFIERRIFYCGRGLFTLQRPTCPEMGGCPD
jgi:hypothetical protein